MKYVKRVISNIKGGIGCELGPKTLIVGPRGSGKSALVNAIQFALTKSVDDIAGRETVAIAAELLSLAPAREGLWSNIFFDDDTVASCSIERKLSASSKPKHEIPQGLNVENVFPLRHVLKALCGNAETIRKFLLKYAVGEITDATINAQLDESLRDYYRRILQSCSPHITPIDRLLEINTKASVKAREVTARVKAATQVSEATAQRLSAMPSPELMNALRNEITALRNSLEDGVKNNSRIETMRGMAANIDAIKSDGRRLATQLQELLAKRNEIEDAIKGVEREISLVGDSSINQNIIKILDVMELSKNNGECLTCGSNSLNIIEQRYESIKAAVSAQMLKQQQLSILNSRIGSLQEMHQNVNGEVQRIEGSIAQNKTALNTASSIVSTDQIVDISGLKAEIAFKEKTLRELEGNSQLWKSTQLAKDESKAAALEAEKWNALADECSRVIKELLETSVSQFAERVQARLPRDYKFVLQLRDGKREAVRMGFERGGIFRTALSGGEWSTVTSAVADCCIRENAFAIIVPEDRGTDGYSLADTLDGLSNCNSQVIVTATTLPMRTVNGVAGTYIPTGWAVIYAENGDHRRLYVPSDIDSVTVPKKRGTKKQKSAEFSPEKVIPESEDYAWSEE